jgi:hypothetical protein
LADNVPITAGIGTTFATDDIAGVHYQIIKQAYGALDSATLVAVATPLPVGVVARADGGFSKHRLLSAATTNATSVKASAGKVGGWYVSNTNAAGRWLKFYDKASAPTVGTDVPFLTIFLPPGVASNVTLTTGIDFPTGIAFALTTGVADADVAAVAANEIVLNLFYK